MFKVSASTTAPLQEILLSGQLMLLPTVGVVVMSTQASDGCQC